MHKAEVMGYVGHILVKHINHCQVVLVGKKLLVYTKSQVVFGLQSILKVSLFLSIA